MSPREIVKIKKADKKAGSKDHRKIFVMDTNVLIHDPEAIFHFEDNDVVIPMMVIEELDQLKKGNGDIPYSARSALKNISGLVEQDKEECDALTPGGGKITIADDPKMHFNVRNPDNWIVSTALDIRRKNPDRKVVLISKDTGVRIKAKSKKLDCQDYEYDKATKFTRYGRLLEEGKDDTNGINSWRYILQSGNIFTQVGNDQFLPVRRNQEIYGIRPKNILQECAVDALLSDRIDVLALTGRAGTGKTILAIAAGLHQVGNKKQDQVIVARPIVPVGNDLGFLPGDVTEKLFPWMQPVYDNLDVIVGTPKESGGDDKNSRMKSSQYLIESGIIELFPLTYIRGRSLPRRYIIIDEAQNLRPLDVKTIITRCGESTKIVFTGDIEQIDSPFLDSASNGLSYLIDRFLNERNFCYLNLKKSARSNLADQAARLL